jgi:hypothetical protein
MPVIAYLLYGDNRTYQLELALSVLSALRFLQNHEAITIAVLSDRADLGFELPVERLPISSEEIAEWTGGGTYNHRAKILALMKAIDHYQAPTVLMDTDTYFIASPIQLFQRVAPQHTLMHAFEYQLGQTPLWQPLFEKFGSASMMIAGIQISPTAPMYNSGVVGLDPTDRSLLNRSLELLDQLHSTFPIFNAEQFALGAVLNQTTNLAVCPDVVKHYWGHERNFIHVQSNDYLQNYSLDTLNTHLAALPSWQLGYPDKPLSAKLNTRLLSLLHRWHPDYRFAYLAYCSALHYARTHVPYANLWSNVALRSLELFLEKHPEMQADDRHWQQFLQTAQRHFRHFRPTRLQSLPWLTPELQQTWSHFWQQR